MKLGIKNETKNHPQAKGCSESVKRKETDAVGEIKGVKEKITAAIIIKPTNSNSVLISDSIEQKNIKILNLFIKIA